MRLKYGINELFDYFKLCERAVLNRMKILEVNDER